MDLAGIILQEKKLHEIDKVVAKTEIQIEALAINIVTKSIIKIVIEKILIVLIVIAKINLIKTDPETPVT